MDNSSYLFISYPIKSFWLAHIYEQMLAFEIKNQKINWQVINIGTGYIFIKLNKYIQEDDFLNMISLPDFCEKNFHQAWQLVQKETKINLNIKPAYELAQFQSSSVLMAQKVINSIPSIRSIKKFIDLIIEDSEKVLIAKNRTHVINKKGAIKPGLTNDVPLLIKNKNIKQISIRTNAQNVLDSYFIEIIGRHIEAEINKNIETKTKYLPFQSAKKTFYLSYIVPKDQNEDAIYDILKQYDEYQFKGPFKIQDDLCSQVFQEFQYFDWGVILNPRDINKKINCKSISYRYQNNTIRLVASSNY